MTKPLSRLELDTFTATVCQGLEEHPPPEMVSMVIAIWEPNSALLCSLTGNDDEAGIAQVDQLLASRPRAAAAATRVLWTNDPDPSVPTLPSWLLTAVTPGRSALFCVRQDLEGKWYTLQPKESPWAILSTASALRGALEQGKPMHFKASNSRDLLQPPGQGPTPPVDEHGRI